MHQALLSQSTNLRNRPGHSLQCCREPSRSSAPPASNSTTEAPEDKISFASLSPNRFGLSRHWQQQTTDTAPSSQEFVLIHLRLYQRLGVSFLNTTEAIRNAGKGDRLPCVPAPPPGAPAPLPRTGQWPGDSVGGSGSRRAGSMGLGTSPATTISSESCPFRTGNAAAISALVYGCRGSAYSASDLGFLDDPPQIHDPRPDGSGGGTPPGRG